MLSTVVTGVCVDVLFHRRRWLLDLGHNRLEQVVEHGLLFVGGTVALQADIRRKELREKEGRAEGRRYVRKEGEDMQTKRNPAAPLTLRLAQHPMTTHALLVLK